MFALETGGSISKIFAATIPAAPVSCSGPTVLAILIPGCCGGGPGSKASLATNPLKPRPGWLGGCRQPLIPQFIWPFVEGQGTAAIR
jgi:hypothetical protein